MGSLHQVRGTTPDNASRFDRAVTQARQSLGGKKEDVPPPRKDEMLSTVDTQIAVTRAGNLCPEDHGCQ